MSWGTLKRPMWLEPRERGGSGREGREAGPALQCSVAHSADVGCNTKYCNKSSKGLK